MLRIVLIRPGCTDYDNQGRIQGTLDIPLNERGSHEVLQLIGDLRGLGMESLFSSPCQPALQTAEAVAEALNLKLKRLDRMQNLDHGLWQGMLIDDVRRKQPKVYRQWQDQPECVCPPEGETLNEATDRVRTCLTKLLKKWRNGTFGLVIPEPLASIVRSELTRGEVGDLWKASREHERFEVLEISPQPAPVGG